jgi:two-component system phosphate regulon sensor histidine kinase PhoR
VELVTSSSDSTLPHARSALIRVAAAYGAIAIAGVVVLAITGVSAWAIVAVAIMAIVACGVLTAALFTPRLRRLARINDAAESFASGRFDVRVPPADDELQPLAHAINATGGTVERILAELRLGQTQLEALLNASSDATLAIDRAGLVVYLNNAARRTFPADSDGAARSFIELVRDHELNDLMFAAVRRGESSVRVVPYGPAQRWLQATAVPIEGGGTWAALAVFHDLTEVRRLDSMRRDFISNVSHELRTPLSGIRAAAETLQEGALDDRPAAEEFVGHIVRETDRLTQMVEELLELSRIESGAAPLHLAPIDASELVAHVTGRFVQQAERAGLRLTHEAPHGLRIVGDAERIDRALGNLIANAIKFTPEGGEIVVCAQHEGADFTLSVRDTGVGIEAADQDRVFERFYKTDRSRGGAGVGLGLAIVKHIARAHEGTVGVESRPGHGATFTIRLPMQRRDGTPEP